MKNLRYGLLICAFAGMLASCDSTTSEKIEEKVDTLGERIDAAVDNGMNKMHSDEDFVEDALEANTKELHMLNNGVAMLTNAELKAAAKKMQADHKKMGEDLMAYAAKKNMQLDLDTADNDHMDEKKGAEYDKEWIDHMVDDHQKAVDMFEDEQDDAKDQELKNMVTGALPTLKKHLEDAKALQEKMKK